MMLGIGLWELVVIIVVLAVFLRPQDIPRALRKLGRLYGKLTSLSSGLLREVESGRREAEAEHRRTTSADGDDNRDE